MSEHHGAPSSPADDDRSFLSLALPALLEAFSSPDPAPGGGSAVAVALAVAASLGAMAARLSRPQCGRAADIERECVARRDEMLSLCDADARAYGAVMVARRRVRSTTGAEAGGEAEVDAALSDAADIPVAMAEGGARLAQLAAVLAEEGNPALRGDAVTAALLAAAGTESAAVLVRINLAAHSDDHRTRRVDALADEARRAATRLGGALPR